MITLLKHNLVLVPLGPEFESRIRQNEINNPKFNFLNPGDPYHAYFQQKVADIKEQDGKGETNRNFTLLSWLCLVTFTMITINFFIL